MRRRAAQQHPKQAADKRDGGAGADVIAVFVPAVPLYLEPRSDVLRRDQIRLLQHLERHAVRLLDWIPRIPELLAGHELRDRQQLWRRIRHGGETEHRNERERTPVAAPD